ncbi:hypothetical protein LINGRAHAP2_LOCUS11301 [Linum grandiflorum]
MITLPPTSPLVINQQRPTLSARNFNSFMRQQLVYNHQIQHPLNNGPGITVGGNHGSMIEDSIWATQTAKHLRGIPSDAYGAGREAGGGSEWSLNLRNVLF